MTAPAVADTAALAFAAVCDEGQRMLRLALLDPDDIGRLLASELAGNGDAEDGRLLRVVAHALNLLDAHRSPGPTAPLCLLCGNQFWRERPPEVFVVLSAAVPGPDAAFAAGICAACRATHPGRALQLARLDGLRERFGIGARLLPPFSAPGHA